MDGTIRTLDLTHHDGGKSFASRENLMRALERDLGTEGYIAYLFLDGTSRHKAAIRWNTDMEFNLGMSAHKGWLTI